MAGGKGKRLNVNIEKPLIEVGGKTILERIAIVLKHSRVDDIFVAVTKNTPKTKEKTKKLKLKMIQTPGRGYVEDIQYLMKEFTEFLSVSADLPFLTSTLINDLLIKYEEIKQPIAVVTSKQHYLKMGFIPSLNMRDLIPIGLNIVVEGEDYFYLIRGKETININTDHELRKIG